MVQKSSSYEASSPVYNSNHILNNVMQLCSLFYAIILSKHLIRINWPSKW